MNIIFLDVEGVLNTKETYQRAYQKQGYMPMIDVEIDDFRLIYLKEIIDKTDAQIVLSSSLRHFFIKENDKVIPTSLKGKKLYDKLSKYNIEIYDTTPTTQENREEQIKGWLENRDDIESFIIIDDDPTQFDEYLDKLIQTSTERQNYLLSFMKESIGLCEEHIEQAIKLLNSKEKTLKKFFDNK